MAQQQSLHRSHSNVWRAVADANKLWYRLAEKNLASLGIIPSELRVLRMLSEQGTCPMAELARDQFMTKGGMTGLVDHLEEQRFIVRIRSKSDRRIINIEITKKGKKLVEKAVEIHQQFVEGSLEDLSEEEVNILARILNKMISSVQKRNNKTVNIS